jgi:hypothetical protein
LRTGHLVRENSYLAYLAYKGHKRTASISVRPAYAWELPYAPVSTVAGLSLRGAIRSNQSTIKVKLHTGWTKGRNGKMPLEIGHWCRRRQLNIIIDSQIPHSEVQMPARAHPQHLAIFTR